MGAVDRSFLLSLSVPVSGSCPSVGHALLANGDKVRRATSRPGHRTEANRAQVAILRGDRQTNGFTHAVGDEQFGPNAGPGARDGEGTYFLRNEEAKRRRGVQGQGSWKGTN